MRKLADKYWVAWLMEYEVDAGREETLAVTAEEESTQDPCSSEIASAMTKLVEQVAEHHARAAARERVIDNLHSEVDQLRAGERNTALRPVVADLQNLRKDLLYQAERLPAEMSRQFAAELLESFALSTQLSLERCGVSPVHPEPGQEFSPREHRAVKVVEAAHPHQEGTVAAVVSDGYLDTTTERVTVPARVHVYRLSTEAPATHGQEENRADV